MDAAIKQDFRDEMRASIACRARLSKTGTIGVKATAWIGDQVRLRL